MTIKRKGLSEIEIINDLIRVNYARMECLEQTMHEREALGVESTLLFVQLIKKCKSNVEELIRLTVVPEHFFPEYLLSPGFIFETWSMAKEMDAGKDRSSLLLDCGHREAAALEAYKAAMISELPLCNIVRQTILDQKHDLQVSQDRIRKQVDLQYLVSGERNDEQFMNLDSTFINTKAG